MQATNFLMPLTILNVSISIRIWLHAGKGTSTYFNILEANCKFYNHIKEHCEIYSKKRTVLILLSTLEKFTLMCHITANQCTAQPDLPSSLQGPSEAQILPDLLQIEHQQRAASFKGQDLVFDQQHH